MGDALSVPFIVSCLRASFAARSRVLARPVSLAQTGELARRLVAHTKPLSCLSLAGGSKETKPIKALFITGNLSP